MEDTLRLYMPRLWPESANLCFTAVHHLIYRCTFTRYSAYSASYFITHENTKINNLLNISFSIENRFG